MITQIVLFWALCSLGFLGRSINDSHYARIGDQYIVASLALALTVALYLFSLGGKSTL